MSNKVLDITGFLKLILEALKASKQFIYFSAASPKNVHIVEKSRCNQLPLLNTVSIVKASWENG